MKYLQLLWLIPLLVLALLVFGIVKGGIIMVSQKAEIVNRCGETDLYAIGNKGRRFRIYDCNGVELK